MRTGASMTGKAKARLWVVLIAIVCATLVAAMPGARPAAAGAGAWTTGGPVDNIGNVAVAPSDNNVIYALGDTGVWRSHNGGTRWHKMGTTVLSKYAPLAVSSTNHNTLFSGGSGASGGIIKSTDGGVTWRVVLESLSVQSLAVHPTNGSIVYAGTRTPGNSAYIAKTTDGGAHWSNLVGPIGAGSGIPAVVDIDINSSNPEIVYTLIQGYHGGYVRHTADGGATWTIQEMGGIPDLYLPSTIAIVPLRESIRVYTGWSLMGSKALARSDNNGVAWCNLTRLLPATGGTITGIVIPDDREWVVAAFGGSSEAPGGVFLSTNGGIVWRDKELGQNPQGIAWASRSNTVFVGTPNGVYQYTIITPAGPASMSYRRPGS